MQLIFLGISIESVLRIDNNIENANFIGSSMVQIHWVFFRQKITECNCNVLGFFNFSSISVAKFNKKLSTICIIIATKLQP